MQCNAMLVKQFPWAANRLSLHRILFRGDAGEWLLWVSRVLRRWKSTSGASGAKGQGRTSPSTTSRVSTTICWTGQGPSLLRWKGRSRGGRSSLWLPHRLSHWLKVCWRRRRIVARLFLWQFEMISTSSCDDGWITGFTVVPIFSFKGMTARVFLINYRVGNG